MSGVARQGWVRSGLAIKGFSSFFFFFYLKKKPIFLAKGSPLASSWLIIFLLRFSFGKRERESSF